MQDNTTHTFINKRHIFINKRTYEPQRSVLLSVTWLKFLYDDDAAADDDHSGDNI